MGVCVCVCVRTYTRVSDTQHVYVADGLDYKKVADSKVKLH